MPCFITSYSPLLWEALIYLLSRKRKNSGWRICKGRSSASSAAKVRKSKRLHPHGKGLPRWLSDKWFACQCRRQRRQGFDPWVGKIPWRRVWQPTPVFLPGEIPWTEVGYSPWSHRESDMMEWLSTQARKKRSGRNLRHLNLVLGWKEENQISLENGI